MMAKSMMLLMATTAALLGACGAETPEPNPVPPAACDIPECFRAVECVAECGGPILSSGCCPCAEGTVDSITCR
jgi:hypothetical protein